MLIFIGIYLVSVVGMWCWFHFMEQSAEPVDIFLTLCPVINTFMNFMWVCMGYILFSEWLEKTKFQKFVNKFFGV